MELSEQEAESLIKRGIDVPRLVARGVTPDQWSPRFKQSIELATGRGEPDRAGIQQPTAFHYPGLPQIPFYDHSEFDWVPAIEAAAPAIAEELAAMLRDSSDEFRAYIHGVAEEVVLGANQALVKSKDWSVLSLCENGWLAPKLVERCPLTWETVLQNVPLPRIPGWGPTVMFSMLRAGARIAAHNGMYNMRLICHLPLIVPPGCRFRVGDEVREWETGKLMIFDDSVEHEAWNDSAEDRVVLIFDIWRPELTEQERRELTLLFAD